MCGKSWWIKCWISICCLVNLLCDSLDMVSFESVFIVLYMLSCIFCVRGQMTYLKCNIPPKNNFIGILSVCNWSYTSLVLNVMSLLLSIMKTMHPPFWLSIQLFLLNVLDISMSSTLPSKIWKNGVVSNSFLCQAS